MAGFTFLAHHGPTPAHAPPVPQRSHGILGAIGRLIGYPGQGTHSFTAPPNNWQSDNAIDIAVPVGTPVYAPVSGVLGPTGYLPGESVVSGDRFAGERINLTGGGNSFYFAHLSRLADGIVQGARVVAGQLLGWTGSASGVAHLHFAVEQGNPASWYREMAPPPTPPASAANPPAGPGAAAWAQFLVGVSLRTGIDPRVLYAWMKQENSVSSSAHFNFLGIGGSGNLASYPNVQTAVAASSALIEKLVGSVKGLTPAQAIARIAASPWDASHYGGPGGPNLQRTFAGIFGGQAGLHSPYQGPGTASAVAAAAGTGSAADWTSGGTSIVTAPINAAKGAVSGIEGAASAVGSFFTKLADPVFWLRALEVVGGAVLFLFGVYLLAKEIGLRAGPVPTPARVKGAVA